MEYEIKPEDRKSKFESKIRLINKNYNSLGVTIPKEIVKMIDLKKGDVLEFNVSSVKKNKVSIDMTFKKV